MQAVPPPSFERAPEPEPDTDPGPEPKTLRETFLVQLYELIYIAIHAALGPPETAAGRWPTLYPNAEMSSSDAAESGRPATAPESPRRRGAAKVDVPLSDGSGGHSGGADAFSSIKNFGGTLASMAGIHLSLEKWLGKKGGTSIFSLLCLIYICYQLHTIWGISSEMYKSVGIVIGHLEEMQAEINSIVEESVITRGNIATGIIIDKMNKYELTTGSVPRDEDLPDLQEALISFAVNSAAELGEGAKTGIEIWRKGETASGEQRGEGAPPGNYHSILEGLRDTAIILASGQDGLNELQKTLMERSSAFLEGATSELGGVFTQYAQHIQQISQEVVHEAGQQGLQYFHDYFNTFTPAIRFDERQEKFKLLAMQIIPTEAAGVLHGVGTDIQTWAQVLFINITTHVKIIVHNCMLLSGHVISTLPVLIKLIQLYKDGHLEKTAVEESLKILDGKLEELRAELMAKLENAPPAETTQGWMEALGDDDARRDMMTVAVLPGRGTPRSKRKKKKKKKPKKSKKPKKKKQSKKKPKQKQSKKKPKKKKKESRRGRTSRR